MSDLASDDQARERSALNRVWSAIGCAPNPDDFKPAVRDQMWDAVVDHAEKDAAKNNSLYRENAELLSGVRSRDARTVELEAEVAARDAVIAEAPHHGYCRSLYAKEWPCDCWKSAAPSSVLAARDAEKWDEGYDAGSGDENFNQRGSSGDRDANEHPHSNPYRAGADHE